MQKTKEKCCVNCKHCVRCQSDYGCDRTATRDRVDGRYQYNLCRVVADTADCEFEDNTKQKVTMFVISLIIATGVAFFIGWNIL